MQDEQHHPLVDALRSIGTAALDGLYSSLCAAGCVGSVRLACSGLRRLIDSSVHEVRFAYPVELPVDQWPSLSTWPRCERLAVTERDEDDAGYFTFRELQEVVEGVQVWLLNQPAASLARIRELRLDLWAEPEGEDSRRFVSAPFIALLARLLPNLQALDMEATSIGHMPCCQAELRALVLGGLARMSQLEKLALPCTKPLALLLQHYQQQQQQQQQPGSSLFPRLRELSIRQGSCCDASAVGTIASGIASISGLQILVLDECLPHQDAASLFMLLDCLPPSLSTFRIHNHISKGSWDCGRLEMELTFEAGQLRDVCCGSQHPGYRSLALLARDVLLPLMRRGASRCGGGDTSGTSGTSGSSTMRPLRLLHLETLSLRTHRSLPVPVAPLEGSELAAMRELVRGCSQVVVDTLRLSLDMPEPAALQAMEVLGLPGSLEVNALPECDSTFSGYCLRVRVSPPPPSWPQDRGPGEQLPGVRQQPQLQQQQPQHQQQPQQHPPVIGMPPEVVLSRAVQLLLALPPLPAAAAASASTVSAAAGGPPLAPALEAAELDGVRPQQMLVLRGPLVAGLAMAPQALSGWLEWLGEQAAAAVAAGAADGGAWADDDASEGEAICRCQVVPSVPALLLQMHGQAGGFAALHSVVRKVAPATQLDVVAVETSERLQEKTGKLQLSMPLLRSLQQVLDEGVWRHAMSAEGAVEAEAAGGFAQAAGRAGAAPPGVAVPLQEQIRWLQGLGRTVASELPRQQTFMW
ncbi:hypothetical protein CHLRE_10g421500v5 [Chlamydomonas reinhardtii]|uniref:Uncharacterized protein n=1 Tax=Chlamydomonas reinhardtii TaxID=3055 RepID=A0A2K3D976_CHLRE|nr:uncharacterized protein CHLRE_10g421500v5 [Chlamydomonas reinhardtii]PNW77083.1 hypothetical protein CHLRE_10g421500v5 [Chlamydomonas reinhardtii]